eukprot:gnl/Chilomastix_cuspidata/321.p2 GENE.gnl/Chilomastix_cuspidata/321~~gnl/Chilomastix_cuspidata/321.p2  ORF type:complete len:222 (-),score=74.52 gnl/Chilomastix_cuspidata/321:1743-2408(-)
MQKSIKAAPAALPAPSAPSLLTTAQVNKLITADTRAVYEEVAALQARSGALDKQASQLQRKLDETRRRVEAAFVELQEVYSEDSPESEDTTLSLFDAAPLGPPTPTAQIWPEDQAHNMHAPHAEDFTRVTACAVLLGAAAVPQSVALLCLTTLLREFAHRTPFAITPHELHMLERALAAASGARPDAPTAHALKDLLRFSPRAFVLLLAEHGLMPRLVALV